MIFFQDEGFESDTDSAKSLEAAAASPEEKVQSHAI